MALIARRPDHTREAFREHYEKLHAPLAIATVMEGATHYVRHHLLEELHGRPFFDVVTAFRYRDAKAARETMRRLGEEEGKQIIADEHSFMDRDKNTFFGVTERLIRGNQDRGAGLSIMALVKAPGGEETVSFMESYETQEIPALLDATTAPAWCLQNRAVAFGSNPPAYDAVTQIHARSESGAVAWAKDLEAKGCEVILLSVAEYETETPWT